MSFNNSILSGNKSLLIPLQPKIVVTNIMPGLEVVSLNNKNNQESKSFNFFFYVAKGNVIFLLLSLFGVFSLRYAIVSLKKLTRCKQVINPDKKRKE